MQNNNGCGYGCKKMMSLYKKRKESLKKKAMELSVLCDIKVCLLCYDSNGQLDTWPENRTQVQQLLDLYNNNGGYPKTTEILKKKKKEEQEEKDNWQLLDIYNNGRNTQTPDNELLLNGLSQDSLKKLLNDLDSKLDETNCRIDYFLNMKQKQSNGDEINYQLQQQPKLEEDTNYTLDFLNNNLESQQQEPTHYEFGQITETPNWFNTYYQQPSSGIFVGAGSSYNPAMGMEVAPLNYYYSDEDCVCSDMFGSNKNCCDNNQLFWIKGEVPQAMQQVQPPTPVYYAHGGMFDYYPLQHF